MNRALAATVLAILVVSTLGAAEAQRRRRPPRLSAEERRARELFDHGDTLYANGSYEEAISAFQEAYELAPRPLLLYNLANAQERAGHFEDALTSLESYLPDAPEPEQAAIENRIENLRERLAEREAEAEAAAAAAHEAELEAQAARAPPPAAGPDLVPAIVLFSVAGAFVLGGGITGGLALSERDAALANCSTVGTSTFCADTAAGPLGADEALSITTDIFFVAAAASLGVGIYFLVDALSGSGEDDTQVSLAVDPRGGAITSIRSRF